MTLTEDVFSYLEAADYNPRYKSANVIRARQSMAGGTEIILVVVVIEGIAVDQRSHQEASLLKTMAGYVDATERLVVTDSREGFTRQFWREVIDLGFAYRSPIGFFDQALRSEQNPRTYTVTRNYLERGNALRVQQPFVGPDTTSETDLFPVLSRWIRSTDQALKPVALVVAPAGYGKSALFNALFKSSYDNFTAAKKEERRAYRPFPLVPELLVAAGGNNFEALIHSFVQSEVSGNLRRQTFEWLLTHGYAAWMIDGLDELIGRDPEFFETVIDLVAQSDPSTPPRVLICVRDSLLTTNENLRDFVGALSDSVNVYRLSQWSPETLSNFAHRRYPERADDFLTAVEASTTLAEVCRVPFYANLFAEIQTPGRPFPVDLTTPTSPSRLLSLAIEKLVEREYAKGLFAESEVQPGDIFDIATEVAVEDFRAGRRGVSLQTVDGLLEVAVDLESADDPNQLVASMHQLSLFDGAEEYGRVRIGQEVLGDYLVGNRACQYFDNNPTAFLGLLDRQTLPSDSAALSLIANHIDEHGAVSDLLQRSRDSATRPTAFRNLVILAACNSNLKHSLREFDFERMNLSGIEFVDVDLSGVSLRASILENTIFRNCLFAQAVFEGARMSGTVFSECSGLGKADFGTEALIQLVEIDDHEITSLPELLSEVGQGVSAALFEPCVWAQQTRMMMGKFVRLDGQPKRSRIDKKALRSGRRMANPDNVMKEMLRDGFLVQDRRFENRVERPSGDRSSWGEMVAFVQFGVASEDIIQLIDHMCGTPGCAHTL